MPWDFALLLSIFIVLFWGLVASGCVKILFSLLPENMTKDVSQDRVWRWLVFLGVAFAALRYLANTTH